MRAMPSLGKNRYLRKAGFLLIAVALIAAILSCEGEGDVQYDLTMAVNPAGAGTATDETGASPYESGTVVNIEAVAAAGYQFDSWTAPAGTFSDPNAATTTFTMPAQDVTVTANFVAVYHLTMAVSPAGGGTATDLTGASPYPTGTVVNIQAAPAAGYQFVEWTAPAGAFGDPDAPTTDFTMPAQNVTATAHFVGPLDHFRGYWVDYETAPYIEEFVSLEDQFFVAEEVLVEDAWFFFNPVEKVHEGLTPISNPDHHFTVYGIDYEEEAYQNRNVEITNQFGTQQLVVSGPIWLAVPTRKVEPGNHEAPLCLDHYLIYQVLEGPTMEIAVELSDQFGDEEVNVYEPVLFANPVRKIHGDEVTEIMNLEDHLVFYATDAGDFQAQIQIANQFGEQTLDLLYPEVLAVPSKKTVPPAPLLDHFKGYYVADGPAIDDYAIIEDQFGSIDLPVMFPEWFCNPAEKVGLGPPIVNPDNHLILYAFDAPGTPWAVEIDNQFGPQSLDVYGPLGLAVPTQKLIPGDHGPPAYLDHFLLYQVAPAPDVGILIDLSDQFGLAPATYVAWPVYFANPVLYKYHDGHYTGAWDPEAHIVFYAITPTVFPPIVLAGNQFGADQSLTLHENPAHNLLGVPSVKVSAVPLD